jgi:glycosyltransferase involved in cell wall biosynthesis
VLRVIARMNVGGPAYHVSLLSGALDPERYETLLVAGGVGPGEESFDHLADYYGATLHHAKWLGPRLHPINDLLALVDMVKLGRRFRPHIIHTHTAKAGVIGRIAALLLRPRPIIVHTYHGHVLTGYFGKTQTAVFRFLEITLARVSNCLIGVSEATVNELLALGVGRRDQFRVVPLGLDLQRFLEVRRTAGDSFRREIGVAENDVLAVFVGRLVPIKQVQVLFRALVELRSTPTDLHLAVVGDGELRADLERYAQELAIDHRVHFTGFRYDLDRIAAATDIAVLSSLNEGTPVALIEASAAGKPAVATDVGGVRDIVRPETGRLVAAGDHVGFSHRLQELATDRALREDLGRAARVHVGNAFSAERLVGDVGRLYEELLRRDRR